MMNTYLSIHMAWQFVDNIVIIIFDVKQQALNFEHPCSMPFPCVVGLVVGYLLLRLIFGSFSLPGFGVSCSLWDDSW